MIVHSICRPFLNHCRQYVIIALLGVGTADVRMSKSMMTRKAAATAEQQIAKRG